MKQEVLRLRYGCQEDLENLGKASLAGYCWLYLIKLRFRLINVIAFDVVIDLLYDINPEEQLCGLVHAAVGYHKVLAENRLLYNEVQDLKGEVLTFIS